MTDRLNKLNLLGGLAVLLFALGFFYLFVEADAFKQATEFLDQKIPTALFIVMMFILPAIGFPVSIFLVLAGVKFGLAIGLALMLCSFPIHMLASYWLAHSVLRDRLISFLDRHGYELPQAPDRKMAWFTIIFMGIPGIPYAPKNYILALSGVPFAIFMGLGLPVHAILGAPFLILGVSTAKANILVSVAAILAVGLGYVLFLKLKRHMG